MVPRRRINPELGMAALRANPKSSDQVATAVRFCLEEIANRFPGGAVELRVPPYGAIQCISGSNHRRGTPPNVLELEPQDFLSLCLGVEEFEALQELGKVHASGVLVFELKQIFPLFN